MPSKTFFRLSPEKQKRLLEAAGKEFSRVPLQEASIANIVKLAEIPRGSFYQYFTDKEDLYYCYFDSLRQNNEKDLEKAIKKNEGDIFKAFEDSFSKIIRQILIGPNSAFYRNLFMYLDYHKTDRVSPEFMGADKYYEKSQDHHSKKTKKIETLFNLIDSDKMKITDNHELLMLVKLMVFLVHISINEGYRIQTRGAQIDVDQISKDFKTRLNWVKYGVYKNEVGEKEQ